MTTMEMRYGYAQFTHAKKLFYKMWVEKFLEDGLSMDEIAKMLHHSPEYLRSCLHEEDKKESNGEFNNNQHVKYNGIYPVKEVAE